MNLPAEDKRSQKPVKAGGIAVFVLLLVVVLGLAALMYMKNQGIDINDINLKEVLKSGILQNNEKAKPEIVEIKYDSKENTSFAAYKQYIIKCEENKVSGLDKNGEEQWSIPVTMTNPMVKATPTDLLVADIGGRDIVVINGKTVKWTVRLDNNIINADISEDGYVSVVREEKRAKGAVTVYSLQGTEFFTKGTGERFVLLARVSHTGKQVVINSIDTSGIKARTNLEFMDMLGKSTAAISIKEDGICPSVWCLNDDSVISASDSMIMCFDRVGKEKWKKTFSGGKIYSSGVMSGKYAVIAVHEGDKAGVGGGDTEVRVLNSSGDQAGVYKLEGEVRSIEAYGDIAAVNSGREVHFINSRGKRIGKYSSKTDITGVSFFDRTQALVISKGSAAVVPVK